LALAVAELAVECFNSGHILALYLRTQGDFILVGDLLRSVTLLQFKPSEGVLEECARDFNSNSMRAIEIFGPSDDDSFLGADDCGNLFTVRRAADATSEEDQGKMDPHGEYHLGDYVNVFRHGSLNHQPVDSTESAGAASALAPSSSTSMSASKYGGTSGGDGAAGGIGSGAVKEGFIAHSIGVKTSILFGTVSGSIGTILTLTEESYRFYSTLERALKTVVTSVGVGGLSHDDFRSFYNERRTHPQRNFVDGDMVEKVLDLPRKTLEDVVRQFNEYLNASTLPKSSASAASSSYSLASYGTTSMLAPGDGEKGITAEEVLRRIEEIVRLH
jgi:DNA damage-binding protein 1